MKSGLVRRSKTFVAGLVIVLCLTVLMFVGEEPFGSDFGRIFAGVSMILGFSLGASVRSREQSKRLASSIVLPMSGLVLVIVILKALGSYWYDYDYDRQFLRGSNSLLLLVSYLSSFILPILLAASRSAPDEGTSVSRGTVENCRECGEEQQGDWRICPYCGTERSIGGGQRKTCPSCGKPVEGKWIRCPYCGASVTMSEHAELKCPNCGKPTKLEWKKCPYCATKLEF